MVDDQKILKYRLNEGEELRLLQVIGETTDENPTPKFGYVNPKNDTIYMCIDKDDLEFSDSYRMPIFFINDDGAHMYRDAENNYIQDQFKKENIQTSSFKKISESIDDRPIYTEDEEISISGSGRIFTPTISEGDDFLKKIVKTLLQWKKIDLRILQKDLANKYTLTNMKAALVKSTKMTTGNFVPWMNLLRIGFKMELYDEEGHRPIGEPIPGRFLYDSKTDKVVLILDGDNRIKIAESEPDENGNTETGIVLEDHKEEPAEKQE